MCNQLTLQLNKATFLSDKLVEEARKA